MPTCPLHTQQLCQATPLPKSLETVNLTGALPTAAERRALAEDFPVAFHWEVTLLGNRSSSESASIITFIGGIQLFFMGIFGQYLAKAYTEIKNRPIYIVAEQGNLKTRKG